MLIINSNSEDSPAGKPGYGGALSEGGQGRRIGSGLRAEDLG